LRSYVSGLAERSHGHAWTSHNLGFRLAISLLRRIDHASGIETDGYSLEKAKRTQFFITNSNA